MKHTVRILALVGFVAFSTATYAQETTPAGTPAAQASETSPAADQAPPAAAETPPATDAAPAPAAADAAATGVAAADATAAGTNTVTEVAAADATAATDTNAPAAAVDASGNPVQDQGAVIPLIVMDDVPLTDAIKNLARQANLNYMLDPKVNFGQTGADGKPVPQPMVSLRWENVTAVQALDALLGNYNLQMVEDPRSKIARVTVRDPAAPDPLVTRVVQLDYANPSNIVSAVQNTLTDKRSKVVADVRTSQLVLLATEKELASVENLVERLDTPTRQVLIEAKLLETSMSPATKKGLDWSGTLQAQNLKFGNNLKENNPNESVNNTLASGSGIPKMLFDTAKGFNPSTAFLDADGVSAVLSFLNTYSEAKVLSAPRTVTLDNEPARIEVTRASPIINVTPGTVQVSGGSQIQYTNLGIILNVTPRISANNQVNLKVVPEVSRVFATVTKLVADGVYQADEYDIRRMETRVMIPSGNTLVLGGLVQDDVRKSNTKVPVLGDIPYLGSALFRADSKSRQKSNLLVFLTPTIVEDADFQPATSDFLKTPAPSQDSVDGDWSAWDTGKPAKEIKKEQASGDSDKFAKIDLNKSATPAPEIALTNAE